MVIQILHCLVSFLDGHYFGSARGQCSFPVVHWVSKDQGVGPSFIHGLPGHSGRVVLGICACNVTWNATIARSCLATCGQVGPSLLLYPSIRQIESRQVGFVPWVL